MGISAENAGLYLCQLASLEAVAFVYNKSVQLVPYFNHCLNIYRALSLWNSLPLKSLKITTVASFL